MPDLVRMDQVGASSLSSAGAGLPARRFVTCDDPRWTQCHASTIAVGPHGPVVAWFAGTREGTADNRIWFALLDERGRSVEIRQLDTGLDVPHWNPVLAPGPDGLLWLFVKVGHRISGWRTLVTRSADGGRHWEPVRELVPGDRSGGRGPVRNPPLLTPDGLWLAPGSVERWGDPPCWDPFVDVSADGGQSWSRVPIPVDHDAVPGAGLIQPALWWGWSGPVALLRGTAGRAYRSSSPDGGRGWTPAERTALPNNNSGLAALALPSGRVVCAHNPVAESWGPRCPLVLAVSDDDGLSWHTAHTVEDGVTPVDPAVPQVRPESADDQQRRHGTGEHPAFAPADKGVQTSGVGEFSYPCLALDGDQLLVGYTWQRRGIVLARLPVDELEADPPARVIDEAPRRAFR